MSKIDADAVLSETSKWYCLSGFFVFPSRVKTECGLRCRGFQPFGTGIRIAICWKAIPPDAGEGASNHDVREASSHALP